MTNSLPQLRSYTLTKSGHFEAAHWLPGYPGKCAVLHGHRWEVTATIDFPIVPRELVSPEDPDGCGMLVDFNDIEELWREYDHPEYGPLNEVISNPTAEVLANILLEALCDLVDECVGELELPYNATITLFEGPDSSVEVNVYRPHFPPEEWDRDYSCSCAEAGLGGVSCVQTVGTIAPGAQGTGVRL